MKFTALYFITITSILFASIPFTIAYIFNGNEILDLHTNGTAFVKEANAWSVSGLVAGSTIYSDCAGDSIMGGYNVLPSTSLGTMNQYFQRVYTGLPAHTVIRYSMRIYAIDSWDTNNNFKISFDNTVIEGLYLSISQFSVKICGSTNWADVNDIMTYGTVAHSRNTLTLRLISGLDQSSVDESLGFRDVNLIFAQTPANPVTLCGRSLTNTNVKIHAQPAQRCACPEGQYLNGTVCTNCSAGCSSCFGPASTDCFACKKPGYGWNGTYCAACSSGCFTYSGMQSSSCLPCSTGQIYYPEADTCLDYCDYPLQLNNSNTGKTCIFPCNPGSFLYLDQTCSVSCPAPYQALNYMNTYKFCTL